MNTDGTSISARAYSSTFSLRCPVMYTTCSTLPSFLSSSSTYDMTGLPATFIIGFGRVWVGGRRRGPLPARGTFNFQGHPLPPVRVYHLSRPHRAAPAYQPLAPRNT